MFFFGDYVHTLDDSGRISRGHIPEAAFRTGDFSAAPMIVHDPATGNPDGTGRRPFPNNRIPADRISPVARRLLDQIPLPNVPGVSLGAINYEQPYVRSKTTDQFDIRLTISRRQATTWRSATAARVPIRATQGLRRKRHRGGIKDYAGTGEQPSYNLTVNYNRVWSSTLIQEIRTGQSYYRNIAITDANGMNLADEIGIPGANLTMFTSVFPRSISPRTMPSSSAPRIRCHGIGPSAGQTWGRTSRKSRVTTP